MTKKPDILMIGDMPGWAFHQLIDFVRSHVYGYHIYYDFTIYNPRDSKTVHSDFLENQNVNTQNTYRRSIHFQRIPILRGVVYRVVNLMNRRGLLKYNGEGLYRRTKPDNSYDLVIFLDYYMNVDADFSQLNSEVIVKGIFTSQFPPKGITLDSNISVEQFCAQYVSDCKALLVGAPSIAQVYSNTFSKPIFFANMAYNEQVFTQRAQANRMKPSFVIGWTGNPVRDFKGFYSHVVPTVETLKSLGYSVELKTQFEGEFATLVDFWNSVDLALIASEADAGPSMFMEASLCGIPSVSTRVGMPWYVIEDGINGLFCERQVEDMVEKVKSLIDNRVLYNAMSSTIRSSYIKKLGVEVQIENWKSLFQTVLNE